MSDKDLYALSPRRRELMLAVERLREASHPVVGASAERLFDLECEVFVILRAVRQDELRNRGL